MQIFFFRIKKALPNADFGWPASPLPRCIQYVFCEIALLTMVCSMLMFSSCSSEIHVIDDVAKEHPYLIGVWSGEGGFMDNSLADEMGQVEVEVRIDDRNQISGSIGDAKMNNIKIKEADFGFSIEGILDSPVKDGHKLDKDHAIILLVLPELGRGNTVKSKANFHLKSNFTFDFGMRVGGVSLIKKPI